MRQCPFCGTDESQTTQLFCHRCHNQIRAELSGEIFSFPDIAGYNNLVKVYGLIFADVPQFSFAKQIILQSLNKHDNFEGMPSDKKVVAEKALNWANKLCDWQVSFDPLGKPTNLSYAENADIYKDIEDTADGDLGHGINAAIEKIRVEIGDDGFAVRALNLCQGCTIKIAGSPKIESDSVMAIEGHAKELKSDVPMIFISAPSYYSQSGDKSVEYAVGKALKYQLDTKGIKAFWWENFNKDTNILGRPIDKQISDLRIAPKIAFGLAFSSIFIGLAFNAENYSQNENCKYETKHFVDFKYSDTEKEYVSFSSAPKDFKDIQRINSLLYSKLPKNRTIRLLTLNEKFTDYPDKLKELFPQNFAGSEAINVDCNACNGTVDAYVKKALEVILNILQHDYYKTVYKPLKDKNGFDSNEEFKNWFCMPTGDVGAFHEIVNAPTNYNCSYAVLDEFGADVHDKIEFFVERANYWDDNEGEAKRIIRLNMVVRETNDKYMASRQLERMANENDPSIAEKCGFLFAEDENQYQQCEVNYQDREAAVKPIVFRFSDYTKSGGKYCIVKDINNLNSGIIGTIKFQSFSGAIKVYNFAVTLARQIVKIPKKAKHKEGRLYDKVKRKIHCPYCAEPLPRFTAKIKWAQSKTGISCLGEECNQAKFGLRKGRILCTQNVQSEYAFALPEGYEKGKSAFITMMGLRDAGKSVFISKLFEVEKNKIDFANSDSSAYQKDEIVVESVQLSDNYIKYALSPYVESVSCYFPRAIEGAEDILTDQLWRKQYLIKESGNGTVGIFADDCSIPYANYVLKTRGDDDVCATLHYAPLMLKLKTHDGLENYFSFYDLPGEEIEKVAKNLKTQISALKEQAKTDEKIRNTLKNIMLLQNSNGIILLVNAGANVNDENKGVEPICNILTKFLEHKDSETENDANNKKDKKLKQVKNVALAVVLCQFDRIEHEFDYDSIVRTLAPLEDADFYKGSEIEEYINACSLEVKDYLKKSGYSRLVGIIDNFAYHKYFAVSAIGHQDSIKDDDDEKKRAITRFISNPRGIDNILIWLAYQMGMID